MVVALIAAVIGLALTGWIYRTDRFWGDETVEAGASRPRMDARRAGRRPRRRRRRDCFHQRENLVAAMLDGKKRAPRDGDID